ncbi:rhomboid family intramembrane serine protease [Candidatus Pacearchaeota archaeon]|nr:rhomboid family intramembrane serine protease [Candidatus Pacearchaeota archaeon]
MESYTLQQKRKFFSLNLNLILIILNILFFFIVLITSSFYADLHKYIALTPELIIKGEFVWTLLTSMFVHASFPHLFFNMISLFFLGSLVEKIIGRKRFLWFYLASGIFAGLFFALLAGFFGFGIWEKLFGNPSIAGVGASGAIFGLVGILAVLIPKKKVYLVGGPLIAIISQAIMETLFPGNAVVMTLGFLLNIYIFISIFAIFSFNPVMRKIALPIELSFWFVPVVAIVPLVIIGLFVNLPIGNTAHLGGFIVGLVYGFYLKNKYRNKTKYISRFFN